MLFAIPFPVMDPVLVEIGPLAIRWYALAYVAGLILGWRYMLHLSRRLPGILSGKDVDDFLFWATLGVILGGRIGYVLFYMPGGLSNDPLTLIAVWRGGMSFHGGLTGVIVALIGFCMARKLNIKRVGDVLCCAVPIGLLLGRIANFINAELYGRVTDVPWAMIFPHSDGQPRHPSQLYEAFFEGLLLFLVLAWLAHRTRAPERPGLLAGLFLAGYGIARFGVEFVRQPDPQLGFLYAGATMGQMLSIPLILAGLWLIATAKPMAAKPLAAKP
ncbi:MAG TPA: prolipoprotein diacylglyceryl transferase [Alphaproteobacteria bacterium]|nr:prolipoprotein diacylglyceryl transferase [Alphaproteobacteria bacterium]